MNRYWALLLLLFSATAHTPAQTISPVIQEYQAKADGKFQIYNDGEVPLTVVLEPHSFVVDANGNPTFRKLDPEIHVQLSSTSFRLQPKQTYFVFYKASSETLPNWFCIYATVTGGTTSTGIKLALQLPHTVYLLDKSALNPDQIAWLRAESSATGNKRQIVAEVENHSNTFSRVRDVQVTSANGKQSFAGFPLFPGQRRLIELDWDGSSAPEHIQLEFDHFKKESELKAASSAQ
ncbi:MAG TPA: hypothetical protein VK709_08195 [Candidatus Saccharimonadales bacterium]|jgi:hypothetical protein|nr:hypothetical protein [Candidatus Saccharimonadales bacterium]